MHEVYCIYFEQCKNKEMLECVIECKKCINKTGRGNGKCNKVAGLFCSCDFNLFLPKKKFYGGIYNE